MPTPAILLARLAALSLLCVLIPVGVPQVAQGVPARSAPSGHSKPYPQGASAPPRWASGHAQRQPDLPVSLRAVDYTDHRLQYRVVGDVVQRSTDGGRRWASILTPGRSRRLRTGGCHAARYHTVTALVVSGLLPGTLFVATGGQPGHVPRTRHDVACAAATGGLFVLRRGGLRRTDSLAAGLPYAQEAHGRTPRAYTLLGLVTDPTNPAVLYADATSAPAALAGPASPPAGLYRSSNGGLYWSPAMAGLPRSGQGRAQGVPRGTLTLDPAHGAIVFDVIGTTLYRSVNRGGDWAAVRGIHARRALHLFINPANPHLVYALTDLGLYHSRDAGATWTRVADRRLPAAGRIRALTFDVRAPASFYVLPVHGPALRLAEPRAPAPPRFDPAVTLTPQRDDRVVLAIHIEPLALVRLTVVRGANPTSVRLSTDAAGFGYAPVRLRGHVVPAALRVHVDIGRRSLTLQPWLPPGWVPGRALRARPAATPVPAATATPIVTPTATPIVTPTATPAQTPTNVPTPTSSPTATPANPTAMPLFSDGFESGSFAAWSPGVEIGQGGSATVESSVVKSGTDAAQLSETSTAQSVAFVRETFAVAQTDLDASGDFDITTEGSARGNVPLLSLLDRSGTPLVILYRQNQSNNQVGLQLLGSYVSTGGTLALNTWAHVEIHMGIAGSGSSMVQVWLNGRSIYQTTTASLGTNGVQTLQIGNDVQAQPFSLYADNILASTAHPAPTPPPTPSAVPSTVAAPKLLIADNQNRRLLITDFNGRIVWEFDNPVGDTNAYNGPLGVRWMPNNQILATFGTGQVGLIDVATKTWVWQVTGYNGDAFQSPYDAEILPDGNLAVATRWNQGGRVAVYNRSTGAMVWKTLLCEAHTLEYEAQGYNTTLPTLIIGGWGTSSHACTGIKTHFGVQEVVYTPSDARTNGQVAWQHDTEYTHGVLPDGPPNYATAAAGARYLLTVEDYYIQKIDRQSNTQLWKVMTPDEDKRVALNPNGGYIFTVAHDNRIEFRDINANLLSQWSTLADGTRLDYPYGIRVITYSG